MIIYNVTIKVDSDVAEDWVKWMKEEHMPEVMHTGLFVDNQLCRLLEQEEAEGITYVAQYFCRSIEEYNKYISEFAQEMREKGMVRFPGKFAAFRTIMEVQ